MKLTHAMKVWLGIGTLWPICYIALFVAFILTRMGPFIARKLDGVPWLFPVSAFATVIPLHLFTVLLVIDLTIFYIIYVIKDERIGQTMKILWILLFFLLSGVVAMPVFYFIYIWKDSVAMSPPSATP